MRICGQEFSSSLLERIGGLLSEKPGISRTSLARKVCEWLDWRSSSGGFQDGGCRKALAALSRRGILDMPKPEGRFSFQTPSQANPPANYIVPSISCSFEELGDIVVEPIKNRRSEDALIWKFLMEQHHYLGSGSFGGAQIRYLIKSERHGHVGAMVFSSGNWALMDRDKYIGWNDAARRDNLKYVVCNDRFLILPTVQVKNLASAAMALALQRLPDDWEARYKVRPVLAETFVDPTRFDGTCYKASNWISVGKTAGRRDGVKKEIFLYSLCEKWRDILCTEPVVRLGDAPRPESPLNWAEREFGTVRLHDLRLKDRLSIIAQDFYGACQSNIPEACGSEAKTKAAYRFFKNEKITMDVILTPHVESTIERIKEHKIVLAPQDTTTLDYTTHPATIGLGPSSTTNHNSLGLILHDTLAFTEDGVPLGVLDAQCWARDPEDKGKSKKRHELPIEQKESFKWLRSYQKVAQVQELCPDTMIVSVGDRESDIYEFFLEAEKKPNGPKLLVRSSRHYKRKTEDTYLWDFMRECEITGEMGIHIPRSGNRMARDAILDIRFREVSLEPPITKKHLPKAKVWAVYALEKGIEKKESAEKEEPANEEAAAEEEGAAVEWLLLTTAPVHSFQDACKRVEWYSGRWGIEIYHRTLKSGCRIEDRQLGTADRLQTCLGVDMVVAWRIYHMTMLGREVPDHPCTVFFEDVEWKALHCYYYKTPEPPTEPPSMKQAVRMIGSLGGHLGRKCDGMPGAQSLWRGLQRLDVAVDMYVVLKHVPIPKIRRSYPADLKAGP